MIATNHGNIARQRVVQAGTHYQQKNNYKKMKLVCISMMHISRTCLVKMAVYGCTMWGVAPSRHITWHWMLHFCVSVLISCRQPVTTSHCLLTMPRFMSIVISTPTVAMALHNIHAWGSDSCDPSPVVSQHIMLGNAKITCIPHDAASVSHSGWYCATARPAGTTHAQHCAVCSDVRFVWGA